jgi:hypothetical protein
MKSVTSHGRSGMKTSVLCSSQSRALVNEERAMIAFFRHVYYSIYSFLFSFHPVLLSKRLARFDSPTWYLRVVVRVVVRGVPELAKMTF